MTRPALGEALYGPRHEAPSGVRVACGESFETLRLYLVTTISSGFCRLALDRQRDSGIAAVPRGADAAALLGPASLAYLTRTPLPDGDDPPGGAGFTVHAFGEHGPALAHRLADAVRARDRHVRGHGHGHPG